LNLSNEQIAAELDLSVNEAQTIPALAVLVQVWPPNVQHITIQLLITQTVAAGSLIYTDEYDIYDALPKWGYQHKLVNHAAGEYARDEDGDTCTCAASAGVVITKCMSIPWKTSGLCYAPGYDRIAALHKKTHPGIWAFSNSSTISDGGAKRCSTRFWLPGCQF
jgi:hypothetical protein